jgi:hypothetical protein
MKSAPFFPKSDAVWDKFCTRIRVATQLKFKYENTKLKKRIRSGTCLTSELFDKIIKKAIKIS